MSYKAKVTLISCTITHHENTCTITHHENIRELIKCLMMTACDLCGACKPWDIHSKSVEAIFEEFHAQVSSKTDD